MLERTDPKPICSYLGLAEDRDASFSYPETAHLCFAADRATSVSLEHQSAFCLSQKYPSCPRFVELAPDDRSAYTPLPAEPESEPQGLVRFPLLGVVLGVLIGLSAILAIFYFYNGSFVFQPSPVTGPTDQAAPSPAASLTATPAPTEGVGESTPTPVPIAFLATPTPTATPMLGDQVYTLSPAAADIGWVVSGEERRNHFGDSFLYAGMFEGQIYHGAFQFDLSPIPRGAPIHQASIQLTGLRGDRLGVGGKWTLHLLASEIDQEWRWHSYQDILNAPTLQTLAPVLGGQDLAVGQTNIFELSPAQIEILETRIIDDPNPKVSFRMDGPLAGPSNQFAWDTGYGPQSRGHKATLLLSVGAPPATPPPYDYVVVTSTPTPENASTAAAIVAQITADATRIGTATPAPPNMVTATPIPDYLIIVPTPTPENAATAQAMAALATAQALTTGTPTPPLPNAVTATSAPSATPTPTYVLITATPTSASVFAAATLSADATAQAQGLGTSTPLPANWVTPIVVTSTPTPANPATAEALAQLATVLAFTTGTPTPTPANMVTATPEPAYVPVTATPTPESVFAAATLSADATARAQRLGTPTPLPANWVTPIVVTSTPTPANAATAEAMAILATAQAFATGTPTPTPANMVTATPTPVFVLLDGELPPMTPTPTPTLVPRTMPPELIGKIAFKSDRSGQEEIYVINPDGSGLALLSDRWPYELALERDAYSADQRFRVFVKDAVIDTSLWTDVAVQVMFPALFYYDFFYEVEEQVTHFNPSLIGFVPPLPRLITCPVMIGGASSQYHFCYGMAHEPAWSPTAERIAFVSNDSGNDEIWVINSDGGDARQLTRDEYNWWDKHPSWSPDGSQIVFWSNRTGTWQIWVMDADGGNLYSLSRTGFNDWDPVWIKYPGISEFKAEP